MNILNTLTIRNLILNKKRTIVTIIGIVLAVALICAVAGMFQSLHQTVLNDTIRSYGKYHVVFNNVKTSDLDYFRNHEKISEIYVVNDMGYSLGITSEDINNGNLLRVVSYDKKAIEMAPLHLIDGRLPTSSDEAVVVKYSAGNKKIGDKITLSIGRPPVGSESSLHDYFYDYDEQGRYTPKEGIETADVEYTIVGFIEGVWYSYNSEWYGYSVITYNDSQPDNAYSDIYVIYKNAKGYNDISKDITEKLGVSYTENNMYLELIGAGFSDNTNKALIAVAAIVIGIIMLSSVFVIKNGFGISVVERYRQFGMLSSIGATSKQIRRMVLFEGLVVGIISILLGIAVGCGAVFVLIQIINELLHEYLNFRFDFHLSMLVIYGTVIASGITIFLACLMPAMKVSKISPIDAIRNSNDIKIKAKKLRTPKYITKLFGIGGEIAHKNLKRSKKKYRTTIVSLVVSIVIFIAISSFIEVISRSSTYYFNDNVQFDIIVNAWENGDTQTDDAQYKTDRYNEIAKLGHIDRYSIARSTPLSMDNFDLVNTAFYDECRTNEYCLGITVQIMAVGEEEFKNYINKLGVKIEDYKHGAILIDEGLVYDKTTKKYKEETLLKVSPGDTLKLTHYKYIDGGNGEPEEEKLYYDVDILKRTSVMPMPLIGFDAYYPTPTLIVSDEYFDELFTDRDDSYWMAHEMYIASSDLDSFVPLIDSYIEDLATGEVSYTNIQEEIKAIKTMVLVIQIFLYGFIGVISLIGVTNIFNTITTNMALRSREFAMLKSVGMTTKEFNRMIRLESILYGLKSLLIGIPIGIGLSMLIYNGMSATIVLKYYLPMTAIIISIVFVFIIVYITMKYSLSKINKQNIIETIRQENI